MDSQTLKIPIALYVFDEKVSIFSLFEYKIVYPLDINNYMYLVDFNLQNS